LDWPGCTSPVLKAFDLPVTVWATLSLLVTVTVAPGDTVRDAGEKAKFWMVMEDDAWPEVLPPAAVVGVLDPEEHAARQRAVPRSATATNRRAAVGDGDRPLTTVEVAQRPGWWGLIIGGASEPPPNSDDDEMKFLHHSDAGPSQMTPDGEIPEWRTRRGTRCQPGGCD